MRARGYTSEVTLFAGIKSIRLMTLPVLISLVSRNRRTARNAAAVDKIVNRGLNGLQALVDECLEPPPELDDKFVADQRAALNYVSNTVGSPTSI